MTRDQVDCNSSHSRIDVGYWFPLNRASDIVFIVFAEAEQHLNEIDLDRFSRITDISARKRFLLSRWLTRRLFAHCFPQFDSNWRFSADMLGRPIALHASLSQPISYSLSHREQLVVCAIGHHDCIGIDAEPIDQEFKESFSAFAFSEQEQRLLRAEHRNEDLARRWTIKEAVAKMSGAVGLDQVPKVSTAEIAANDFSGFIAERSALIRRLHLVDSYATTLAVSASSSDLAISIVCYDAMEWCSS